MRRSRRAVSPLAGSYSRQSARWPHSFLEKGQSSSDPRFRAFASRAASPMRMRSIMENWGKAKSQGSTCDRASIPHWANRTASIGFVRLFWEWDRGAEQELETGGQSEAWNMRPGTSGSPLRGRQPRDPKGCGWSRSEKARWLSRIPLAINTDYCQLLYHAENLMRLARSRKVLDMNPDSPAAAEWLYQISMSSG